MSGVGDDVGCPDKLLGLLGDDLDPIGDAGASARSIVSSSRRLPIPYRVSRLSARTRPAPPSAATTGVTTYAPVAASVRTIAPSRSSSHSAIARRTRRSRRSGCRPGGGVSGDGPGAAAVVPDMGRRYRRHGDPTPNGAVVPRADGDRRRAPCGYRCRVGNEADVEGRVDFDGNVTDNVTGDDRAGDGWSGPARSTARRGDRPGHRHSDAERPALEPLQHRAQPCRQPADRHHPRPHPLAQGLRDLRGRADRVERAEQHQRARRDVRGGPLAGRSQGRGPDRDDHRHRRERPHLHRLLHRGAVLRRRAAHARGDRGAASPRARRGHRRHRVGADRAADPRVPSGQARDRRMVRLRRVDQPSPSDSRSPASARGASRGDASRATP